MIRSSRIPPLLDKICTDGILSSLLISKDGELLGSSTSKTCSNSNNNSNSSVPIPPKGLTEDMIMTGSSSSTTSNIPAWMNMNPNDVGALLAEVLEDYKQLGCELSLLDPSSFSPSGIHSSGSNNTNATNKAGVGAGASGATGTSTSNTSNDNTGDGNKGITTNNNTSTDNTSRQQQQDSQVSNTEDGTKNTSTSTSGNDANKIKETNRNNKDKGRLNCLIIELEMGIIGITSATSSTYVIALAETTTQHGLLKDKLTVLANLLQDNLDMVCYA